MRGNSDHMSMLFESRPAAAHAWIPAGVGDAIEFESDAPDSFNALVVGRVMDVDATAPSNCFVQVSPYEPLHALDMAHKFFKVTLFCCCCCFVYS